MDVIKSFRPFLISTLILLISGWPGLYLLMTYTQPTLWPRWAFFALVIMACTGAAIPLAYLLNHLLPTTPPAAPHVITRQSLWVGVYCASLLWLSIGRLLSFSTGLWLILGFAAIEYLLRTRETIPAAPQNDAASQPPVS